MAEHVKAVGKTLQIMNETEAALGDSVICDRCNATFETFGDKCKAPLDGTCPGFERIDEVRSKIVARVYGFR